MLLLAVLLLTSCGKETETVAFCNFDTGCMLGKTYYQAMGDYLIWNPESDDVRHGLCYDPLCTHKDTDSLCPDNVWLWGKTILTDGRKLYLNVQNAALTDVHNTMYRQIYSLNPDGSDFKLLYTYDASGGTSPVMQISDGFLYFEQGFYRGMPDAPDSMNDQYKKIMRIPVNGGKVEAVTEDEMDMNTAFYVDGDHFFFLLADENGMPFLRIVNKESRIPTEKTLEADGMIRVYCGRTYMVTLTPKTVSGTKEDGSTVSIRVNAETLYLFENNEFRRIAEGDFVFAQNGIWITESAYEYIGTKFVPTGAYGEMTEMDFFAVTTQKIFQMNPLDCAVTEYSVGSEFNYGDKIEIISGADNKLYAAVSNQKQFFETGDSHYRSCLLEVQNEVVSVVKVYEGTTTQTEKTEERP